MMNQLLKYKDAFYNLVAKEIKVRYMGAALGFAWSFGNPLLFTLTYYFVFTYIFHAKQANFALFIVIGLLHWTLFNLTLSQSCETLTGNAGLIKKLSFPRLIIPCSCFSVNLVFWLAGLAIFFIGFHFLGGHFSWHLMFYPFILLLYIGFIWGIGLILALGYVTFRDLKHLVDVLLQVLFWLTPIIYAKTLLPTHLQWFLQLNPVGTYIEAFHQILYQNMLPTLQTMGLMCIYTFLALSLGYSFFKKQINQLVEYL